MEKKNMIVLISACINFGDTVTCMFFAAWGAGHC